MSRSDLANDNQIHPTAFIGPNVKMGRGNQIGPFVVVDGAVDLGDHNKIYSHVTIHGNVRIKNGNTFFPYVSIGFAADIPDLKNEVREDGWVEVGNFNTLKQYVHLQAPSRTPLTKIGNGCFFMPGAYVAHDCKLEDHITMTAGSKLAGVCEVGSFVNMGMGSAVHQRTNLGESSMLGMNTAVKFPIPPFAVVLGAPARILKFNDIGAQRRGLDESSDLEFYKHNFEKVLKGREIPKDYIGNLLETFLETNPRTLRKFY